MDRKLSAEQRKLLYWLFTNHRRFLDVDENYFLSGNYTWYLVRQRQATIRYLRQCGRLEDYRGTANPTTMKGEREWCSAIRRRRT